MARVAFLGVVVVVVVAGCGAPEVPGPAPTPSVVWSEGEPAGDLELDPWVQAVRAGALPEAVALNARDTRSESLHATWTPAAIRKMNSNLNKWSRERNEDGAVRVAGPWPFDPVSVEVAADGRSATVSGCTVEDWTIGRDDRSFDEGDEPVMGWYEVVLTEDGRYLLDGSSYSDIRCESDNLTVGTFDPLPDGDWEYWQEDILKGGFAEDPSEAP
ncbi:hypothetical protein [Oerskovia turbata]|uniref:hypothetical protein n=1 Tax=Oerskovia turbata TaxID=1713 RepID=UPI0010107D1E|nr:hypothetical protein [Oerskovia turbata]